MLVLAIVRAKLVLDYLTLVISHQMHGLRLVRETRNGVAAVLAQGVLLHVVTQEFEVIGLRYPLLGTLPCVHPVLLW